SKRHKAAKNVHRYGFFFYCHHLRATQGFKKFTKSGFVVVIFNVAIQEFAQIPDDFLTQAIDALGGFVRLNQKAELNAQAQSIQRHHAGELTAADDRYAYHSTSTGTSRVCWARESRSRAARSASLNASI